MTTRLGWEQVRGFRLRRHSLEVRAPRNAFVDVCGAICGLHAQLLSSAELSLLARVETLEPGAVRRALWEERTLVKAWAMRGTLHLLPSAEYGLWQAALSTYGHYLRPSWMKAFGITLPELQRLVSAIGEALEARPLTRDELAREVLRKTRSKKLGQRVLWSWGTLLKPACYRGVLCFGPSTGQNVRFTRPDRFLPPYAKHEPREAIAGITRRFLSAYGPATRDDYSRWWGCTAAEARRRIESLSDAVTVNVDGEPAYALRRDVARMSAPSRSVRLLPAFDPYIIAASRHASRLMRGDFRARVYRAQGWLSPVLLVEGAMEGVWRAEKRGRTVHVRLQPFSRIARWARSAAEAEAERVALFLGSAADVRWEPPHAAGSQRGRAERGARSMH
jgi:Winged helix DNA-binding domain